MARDTLPIDAALPDLCAALRHHACAVLTAPPGAGKTTHVPLALMNEEWARDQRIIMLEPRRLAARAAALRIAGLLNEDVGERVGMRMRMDTRVSARTRLEIVTEGVFARMILDDPMLTNVAAVIFDEYHERSLDADLGLALALDAQAGLRPDLRLLVMSATLDGARVAGLMNNAPVITSEGKMFPVHTHYVGRDPNLRIEEDVARVIMRALRDEHGSLLVFLPGQAEITRTAAILGEKIRDDAQIDIAPLFGTMDKAAQDKAIAPSPQGRRKIVLATSIAESALTIDGVRVVIDSGFARVPVFEPELGLTRLDTVRVSRASADQRRGRAGRTQEGVCYRLWEEAANGALTSFTTAELLNADLSGLVLDVTAWGVREPTDLPWLDAPPSSALAQARHLLRELSAFDENGRLSATGEAMRHLPLPPRLARMIIDGARQGHAELSAFIAALITERGLGGDDIDLAHRLERLMRERSPRAVAAKRMARAWAQQAMRLIDAPSPPADESRGFDHSAIAPLLALAFPDRIAKARGSTGDYVMANGRAGMIEAHLPLARAPYLVIADLTGRAARARITMAAALDDDALEALAQIYGVSEDQISYDMTHHRVQARRVRRLNGLILSQHPLPVPATDESASILARGVAQAGIERLAWSKELTLWRERVMFLRRAEGEDWPDLSEQTLRETSEIWLAPFIMGMTSRADINADVLTRALHALVPWNLMRRLDEEAPSHFTAPTGNHFAIDYKAENGPMVEVRVQEVYGLSQHPCVAGGRIPLTLTLLSPAHRPLQITRDLPGFWAGSWADVKTEMKGRYPRHLWPDDPAHATATARAKPRGS